MHRDARQQQGRRVQVYQVVHRRCRRVRAVRPEVVVVDHELPAEADVLGEHYVLAFGAARVTRKPSPTYWPACPRRGRMSCCKSGCPVHSRRPTAPVAREIVPWLVSCWRFGVDDRYGGPPRPVANLLEVGRFRAHARRADLREVTLRGQPVRFGPVSLRMARGLAGPDYSGAAVKEAVDTILVPRRPLRRSGQRRVATWSCRKWARGVVDSVLLEARASVTSSVSTNTATVAVTL